MMQDAPRGELARTLALIGIGLVIVLGGMFYSGHKYQMWRIRRRQRRKEQESREPR